MSSFRFNSKNTIIKKLKKTIFYKMKNIYRFIVTNVAM